MNDNPYASPVEKCGEVDWGRRLIYAADLFLCATATWFWIAAAFCFESGNWTGSSLSIVCAVVLCVTATAISEYDKQKMKNR